MELIHLAEGIKETFPGLTQGCFAAASAFSEDIDVKFVVLSGMLCPKGVPFSGVKRG